MEDIFVRTRMMIGRDGLEILKASSVMVFGLGGVGSYAAEAMVRAGVGKLVFVDHDDVSPSNINRQLHAMTNTIGRAKAELMAERARLINPDVNVQAQVRCYFPGDKEVLACCPDYVIDAIDNVRAKVDLIISCLEKGIPVVSSMGTGGKMDPTAFRVSDISETFVCPLARVIRRELRKKGITSGVKVVFSPEPFYKAGNCSSSTLRGAVNGPSKDIPSISFVPPVAGLILASVVIKDLLCFESH